MSIDKALAKEGLTMVADKLPKEDRTVRTFQRLIAAVRAAEAVSQDEKSEADRQLNASLMGNLELQERCHKLESELQRFRVKETLDSMETISVVDKQKLLEASAA